MEQTGPGPQIGIENQDRLCQNCEARCLSRSSSLSSFAGEGFAQTPQQTGLPQFPNVLPQAFCAPFLDKRGFIKFDNLDVTLFPHTKPPPVLPPLLLQSAWQVPSPSLLCAERQWGAHKPHQALGPPRCKEPSPCHRCDAQGAAGATWAVAGGAGRAGSTSGRGFTLHIPCSYTDPSLGKSRLSHGAQRAPAQRVLCAMNCSPRPSPSSLLLGVDSQVPRGYGPTSVPAPRLWLVVILQ